MIDFLKHGEEILQRALFNGGDLAEIYFEETSHTSIQFEEDKTEKIVSGTELGVGVRLLSGERTLYAHTNNVSLESLMKVADTVAGGVSTDKVEYNFDFVPEHFTMPVVKNAQGISTPEKVEIVRTANDAARTYDPRITQVSVTYGDSIKRVVILNSDGRFVEDTRPSIIFMVSVVAAADGVIQTGLHPVGGRLGFELFDESNPEEVALEAARKACLMLEANPAPTGRMPVVLSCEAGGTMIHEAVGHGLEADAIDKGVSKYCDHLNEEIAVPIVSVVDDGTIPGKRGSCSVDDEGTPMQRTVLIDHGHLCSFMNDIKSARKMNHEPTGNGRRESYQSRPIPRMTNTMILPGKADPGEILSSTNNGLYVRKMGGGQVNPLNGDFVFKISEGYLINNGKAETPVRGATLIGNGPEVLRAIEMVGNDIGFGIGTCGKDGQGVPCSHAQPTLRIRELTIGGTAT